MAVTKTARRQLLLLVMLQAYRSTVSNNAMDESCESDSSYTLYFTSPATGANATHVHSCLYKAVVDSDQEMTPLIRPHTVVCPSQLWPQARQVHSVSYDIVTRTILLHLSGDDDSRFTLLQAPTCQPRRHGNFSNSTDEDGMTSHRPIQVNRFTLKCAVNLMNWHPNVVCPTCPSVYTCSYNSASTIFLFTVRDRCAHNE